MMLIDTFEEANAAELIRAAQLPLPKSTWKTPDGKSWAPQDVLRGWGPKRASDRWAFWKLHIAVTVRKTREVKHIELATPLRYHNSSDLAWQQIAALAPHNGPTDPEPDGWLGRADLALDYEDDAAPCLVEFGTCTPAKFTINVDLTRNDWMIVPYNCPYAFVFIRTAVKIAKFRGGKKP